MEGYAAYFRNSFYTIVLSTLIAITGLIVTQLKRKHSTFAPLFRSYFICYIILSIIYSFLPSFNLYRKFIIYKNLETLFDLAFTIFEFYIFMHFFKSVLISEIDKIILRAIRVV